MTSVVSQETVVSLLSQSSYAGEVDFVQGKCPHEMSSLYCLHTQADLSVKTFWDFSFLSPHGLISEALLETCLPHSPSASLILADRIKPDWDFHVMYGIKIGSLSGDTKCPH